MSIKDIYLLPKYVLCVLLLTYYKTLWPKVMKATNYIINKIPTKWNQGKMFFEIIICQFPDFIHLHVYGCKVYIWINMLLKKQKFAKKIYVGYFIKYNSFKIDKIWNANKNKIIKIKNVIFDKNSCYNLTNIDLNQLISKLFIEIDWFELIQLNFVNIIEIDLKEIKIQFVSIKIFIKMKTT